MYTIPGDPVKFRRARRLRRHHLRVTAYQIVNGMMVIALLLTAAAQGSFR